MKHLDNLVEHCIWANESWIQFLTGEVEGDEYLDNLMSHILLSEQAWFQRIFKQEVNRNIWKTLSPKALAELHKTNSRIFRKLLEQDLDQPVDYQRSSGATGTLPVGDILIHLCTHGFHHRGQMATHVTKIGLKPINTDFVQFRDRE